MASFSYAGLEVRVTADTRGMAAEIRSSATSAGQDAGKTIAQNMSAGLSAIGGLLGSIGKAATAGLGVASTAAIGFGVSAFRTAARVGEMDASLRALAKANNVSYDAMQKSVKEIRHQGIEAGVAQGLVATFTRNQLSLADATKLAAVAQDAAVISGRNSTEVLADLTHGIETQNSLVLRNAGLNVQAGQAMSDYAKSVGKSTAELTSAERAQAVLNAVLKDGEKVAGAYSEAMKEPGKVLRSFPRIVDDIKVSIGQGLVKALGPAILQTYDLAKAFSKAVEPGGKLSPIFDALGVAVGRLVAPVTSLIGSWTKWIENLKPEQVARVVDVIKQFGPAILLAAGALAAFTGGGILTQLPIIGGLFSAMLGPVKLLIPTLLAVGKAAVGVVGGLTGAGAAAGGASSGLSALLGPVGLVIAGLVALVATSKPFRESIIGLAKGIVGALVPAFKAIVAGVREVLPPILQVVGAIGDQLGPVIDRLTPLLAPLGQLLGTVLAQAFGNLSTMIKAVLPAVLALVQVIGFLLVQVLNVVGPVARFAIGFLQAAAAAGAFTAPMRVVAAVLSVLANAIAAVVRWIFGGSPGLIPAFSAAGAAAGALAGPLRAIIGVFAAVAGAVKSLVSVVTSGFKSVSSAVSSAMSAASSAVSSAFSSITSAARSGASAVLSAISSSFGQVKSVVSSTFSGIAGIVSSGLSAAVGAARSGGAAIVSGLQAGMQSAVGAVMSTISGIASKVSGALSSALKIGSPSRLTIPMGRDLFRGLIVGWDRAERDADWTTPHIGLASSPLSGPAPTLAGLGAGAGTTINVYPSASMNERELAAMVSRELAWATAGGV